MAESETKGKVNLLSTILVNAFALLGVVALLMIFVPQIKMSMETSGILVEGSFKSLACIFGGELQFSSIKASVGDRVIELSQSQIDSINQSITGNQALKFSFLNFLPFLLLIVGVLVASLGASRKLTNKRKLLGIVGGIIVCVGAVLAFVAVNGFVSANEITVPEGMENPFKLGVGAILTGLIGLVSGIGLIGSSFVPVYKAE